MYRPVKLTNSCVFSVFQFLKKCNKLLLPTNWIIPKTNKINIKALNIHFPMAPERVRFRSPLLIFSLFFILRHLN